MGLGSSLQPSWRLSFIQNILQRVHRVIQELEEFNGNSWTQPRQAVDSLTKHRFQQARNTLTHESTDSEGWLKKLPPLMWPLLLAVFGGLFLWWKIFHKNHETNQLDAETHLLYQDVDGHAARTKQARRGRCLLSLDGGGILGMSQIAILYEISNRIMYDLGLDKIPRLCDYFDMIGGVGTGGLLAIFIGRLGLTVQQAEKEYLRVMDHISSISADTSVLDLILKAIIKKYTGDSEALMYDPNSPINHCKTFVGAAAAENISRLVKLRSFQSRRGQELNLPIWQVARATLTHPGSFPSIQLGPRLTPVNYISGEFGWNNPSREVIREFESEWKRESIVCFASIGTGHQGAIRIETQSAGNTLNSTAEKMVTDCQRVAEEISHRFQGQNNYFRLNVDQGFQRTGDQTALKLEDVMVHTKAYLDSAWTNTSIDRLVRSLLQADEIFPWQTTREIFEGTIETYLHDARSYISFIKIEKIKQDILEVVSVLELIQNANSNEEEWIRLAKAVNNHTRMVVYDIMPKIWEPYLEHPLWPSTRNYFIQLGKVYTSTKALIERQSDWIWETSTRESLPSKWAADLEESFKYIQGALASEVYNQLALSREKQQEREREELLSSLSPLQPERRHNDVKARRSEGTGMWYLNETIFTAWSALENDENYHILLSFGAPGAGKSILFSTVVESLRKAIKGLDVAVTFIYCDYRDQAIQTIVGIIGSLTKQLLLQARFIPDPIWEMHKSMSKEQKPIDLEMAQAMIKLVLQHFDRVYICFDALDECRPDVRKQLLEFFKTTTAKPLRLFVTGRPNIESELTNSLADRRTSKIPIIANVEDIHLYLTQRFSQDNYPEAMDETLQTQIKEKIIEWSQGIFLLSMLQTEAVLEHDTKRDRREALLRIPAGLSETYTTTLERIREQPRARSERAIKILNWIYLAERQLRVIELQHALAVKAEDTAFDQDGMPSETALVDCCLGLVVIERETLTVRLTHFTLQEYFDNQPEVLLPSAHAMIANVCLTYLAFDHTNDLQRLESSSPFIEYAASNLGHHLRKGGDAEVYEKMSSLLNKEDKFFILKTFLGRLVSPYNSKRTVLESSPLHWATFFGVYSMVKSMVGTTADINAKDNYLERTPLSYAAKNGHGAVVKLLLSIPDVDLNAKDKEDQTPLALAAKKGHGVVVKLLLSTPGIELDSTDYYDQTPLSLAAERGYDTIAKMLINTSGIDLDLRDAFGRTPLFWAARNGHEAVVKLLINTPGVNLDPGDIYGQTPLFWAAEDGRDAVVKLLIDTPRVYLDSKDVYGQTPFSRAAENGHDAVVKLFIETSDVDFDRRDRFGRSPLSRAAGDGHDAVVQLLIDTPGVDIDSRDEYGQTPLSRAAENGHEVVVELLVNTSRIDLNSRDEFGRTPLCWAAKNGYAAVVKLLIGTPGVELSSEDRYGQTPLSRAAQNGHDTIVHFLESALGITD